MYYCYEASCCKAFEPRKVNLGDTLWLAINWAYAVIGQKIVYHDDDFMTIEITRNGPIFWFPETM